MFFEASQQGGPKQISPDQRHRLGFMIVRLTSRTNLPFRPPRVVSDPHDGPSVGGNAGEYISQGQGSLVYRAMHVTPVRATTPTRVTPLRATPEVGLGESGESGGPSQAPFPPVQLADSTMSSAARSADTNDNSHETADIGSGPQAMATGMGKWSPPLFLTMGYTEDSDISIGEIWIGEIMDISTIATSYIYNYRYKPIILLTLLSGLTKSTKYLVIVHDEVLVCELLSRSSRGTMFGERSPAVKPTNSRDSFILSAVRQIVLLDLSHCHLFYALKRPHRKCMRFMCI